MHEQVQHRSSLYDLRRAGDDENQHQREQDRIYRSENNCVGKQEGGRASRTNSHTTEGREEISHQFGGRRGQNNHGGHESITASGPQFNKNIGWLQPPMRALGYGWFNVGEHAIA